MNINAEGILNNLTPKSTEEVDIIQATRRELQEGELKYWGLLEEFDEVNSQLIEEVAGEINIGHSAAMPPPPAPTVSGVKFVKHDEVMPEILTYGISPVEFQVWAVTLTQWLETCYFGQVTPSSFASSLINRLDPTWKRKMNGQVLGGQSPSLNLDKIRDELKQSHPMLIQRFKYFNIKQENREPASETLDRIILQTKVKNI